MLAKYAAEGVATYLLTATRGQKGGSGPDYPGPEALGKIREAELRAAAQVLGLREVRLLDYMDGELDQAPAAEAIAHIVAEVRRVRPQVVVTFGPDGAYGHPDHIAISQFTTAALVAAADAQYAGLSADPPHRVTKLYYMLDTADFIEVVNQTIGEIVMEIDGVARRQVPWPGWAVTTQLEVKEYERTTIAAIQCHQTQIKHFPDLSSLPNEVSGLLWNHATFYRAFSLVNGGRRRETDLFEGLR